MRHVPTTSLPPAQASALAVLLDALDGVALSNASSELPWPGWPVSRLSSKVEQTDARLARP